MKKRLVYLFSVVFFVFLGLLQLGLKPQKVEAAYGILHPYSTPVATRGNWYYLDRDSKGTQKIYTVKITAHAVDKDKLYIKANKKGNALVRVISKEYGEVSYSLNSYDSYLDFIPNYY